MGVTIRSSRFAHEPYITICVSPGVIACRAFCYQLDSSLWPSLCRLGYPPRRKHPNCRCRARNRRECPSRVSIQLHASSGRVTQLAYNHDEARGTGRRPTSHRPTSYILGGPLSLRVSPSYILGRPLSPRGRDATVRGWAGPFTRRSRNTPCFSDYAKRIY